MSKSIYIILFNTCGTGVEQTDVNVYNKRSDAEKEAKFLRWNGHTNVRVKKIDRSLINE